VLCTSLPGNFTPQLSATELLLLVKNAISTWDAGALGVLLRLPPAAQLSTDDVRELLLRMMHSASQLCRDTEAEQDVEKEHGAAYVAKLSWEQIAEHAAELRQEREQVLGQLLDLLAVRQLTTDDVMALLQCSVSHGLLVITRRLLELSVGGTVDQGEACLNTSSPPVKVEADQASQQCSSKDVLGRAELYELLLCCAGLVTEDLLGDLQLKLELFECLLGRAALYGFGGASVCSLVTAFAAGFPWQHIEVQTSSNVNVVHPVLQLLKLPGLSMLNADVMCTVLEACIAGVSFAKLLQNVLKLPAAAQLSVNHIRQLAQACVVHRNQAALRIVLGHPAAPGPDDAEMRFFGSLVCRE
jgi:hypothetical protein